MRWTLVVPLVLLLGSCGESGSDPAAPINTVSSIGHGPEEGDGDTRPGQVTIRAIESAQGLEDYGIAMLTLDPDWPPSVSDRFVRVRATETECANGRLPAGRDVAAVVEEEKDRVSITVLIAPVIGGADCPSNPWFSFEVPLESDLGARRVLDGSDPNTSELELPVVEPRLVVEVAGTPPGPGRANVFAWTGGFDGGLLLTEFFPPDGEPRPVQAFLAGTARTISGFVTECGEVCVEECEGDGCVALSRLGPECGYRHDPSEVEVVVRITYHDTGCSIAVVE